MPESLICKGSGNTKRLRDAVRRVNNHNEISQDKMHQLIQKKIESNRDSIKNRKRSMSTHVGSRWYRAPEISLIEKQYDQASDMWSLGCCLYELMVLIQNKSNLANNKP
jgi:serine/threonine protein kinase